MNKEKRNEAEESYLVRTSLHLSRQKFGRTNEKAFSTIGDEGIILNLAENKALFAIQKILDKTSYEGNLEGRNLSTEQDNNKFQFSGFLPQIQFKPVEYLEAYGLERQQTKRGYQEFNSNERKVALDALKSLADKKFKIVYNRTYWDEKSKELTDIVVVESPLIRIMWGILGMTADEKKKYDNGEFTENELLHRSTIGVEVCPIIVDQIEGYFILIPNTLFNDIKKQLPKGKYSQYIPMFIEWLIVQAEIKRRTKTGWKVEINYKKLAYKLRMTSMIKRRKWQQIREKLTECYEMAVQLGYITGYDTVDGKHESKEVFYLNDEKFRKSKQSDLALPKKGASSTQKGSTLYPKKEQSPPKKGARIENTIFTSN